ncbi:DUF262 domain-containing HNH endonuclease family protein [Actinomadura sp. NPDC048021]|uniref:DUF262 domain-containing protein n=1 Tax=Actinomadura sp. NPDC048021 TaxID=3155385 RepID=UPI0033F6D8F9
MTKEIKSHMLPLTKLFSQDFFFQVPEYQRPFLWDAQNFRDLIDDLVTAKTDEPYFLGTLVLHQIGPSEYAIVDGQQRLTSLCILFACLRDALDHQEKHGLANELHEKIIQPEREIDNIPSRSRLQVKDQAVFNALIKKTGGTKNEVSETNRKTPSGRRYELARSIFWKAISGMKSDELRQFVDFVTQRCNLIYLATDSFEDAFQLFTVVNDRGKQLRRIDVLKAHNLDPAHLPSESSRTKYAHKWEEMEDKLGESGFEEIFHLLRLIYIKDKPQSDLQTEFRKRILGQKGMPKQGAEFMDELGTYVDLYDDLFIARDFMDEDTHIAPRYRTLMRAMIDHFPASEWKSCLLLFARKFGHVGLYQFLLKLEKVYLSHWISGIRKDERYGTYTSILSNLSSATDPNKIAESIEVNIKAIEKACRADNFYGAGHAKYLLVRAEIIASELDHERHFQARSIEHVLPQNPASGSDWNKIFPTAQREKLVDSAGNLVLLSKSKNSSAGRREFEQKKQTYLKPRVSDFPRSMQVIDYAKWTPDVVRKRTEDFATTVLQDP